MRRTALFILIFSLLGATGCTGVLSKKQQEVNAMGNECSVTGSEYWRISDSSCRDIKDKQFDVKQ